MCSKIDRALINKNWYENFVNSEAVFMPEGVFDHSPILISFYHVMEVHGKRPFRYFKMWKGHPDFDEVVAGCWNQNVQGTPMFKIVAKLKKLKLALKQFNRQQFGNVQTAEMEAKNSMENIQQLLQ